VRYPQAKRDEVIALFKAGYKIKKVAEISGVPKTTCYRWGRANKKKPRDRRIPVRQKTAGHMRIRGLKSKRPDRYPAIITLKAFDWYYVFVGDVELMLAGKKRACKIYYMKNL